jgi:hypothetical protein
MALPKISLPIYELVLPSTGEKVKYRPFTLKEEKILLTAQETKEGEQIILSIKQIINNCLINKDVDSLAVFDIEYILITLRSKSIDNMVKFKIKDPDTEEDVEVELDLSKVKVEKNKNHTNKIKISDEYFLFMRYPNIDEFMQLIDKEKSASERNYRIMLSCMEKLVSKDEVFKFSDFDVSEIEEFVDSLQSEHVKGIKEFFDTLPKVRHEIEYKNKKGDKKKFIIQGTETFFI